MPVFRVLWLLSSCGLEVMALTLLVLLSWWKLKAMDGAGQRSRANKLVVCLLDPDLRSWCCVVDVEDAIWQFFFTHQGDGELECWKAFLHRSAWQGAANLLRSSSALVKLRLGYPWSLGPLRAVVLRALQRLQPPGCRAKMEAFIDSVAALNAGPSPSGFVPGGGAGGRDVESFVFLSGEGPDCVLHFPCKVLVVKAEGLVVVSFSLMVLLVICKPTV
jgi:hypothetical protein